MLIASNARINKKIFSSLFTFKQRFFASTVRIQQPLLVDLTSDTATQPTDDMFDIMKLASRSDDVFAVSPLLQSTLSSLIYLLVSIDRKTKAQINLKAM